MRKDARNSQSSGFAYLSAERYQLLCQTYSGFRLNVDKSVVSFIENCLFTTLTNVNFNVDDHVHLLKQSQDIKNNLKNIVRTTDYITPSAAYELPETKADMLRDAPMAGIMYDKTLDPDIRSLRQTILYGLKGISAYGHQARELSYYSDNVDNFYIIALEAITDNTLTVEELSVLLLKQVIWLLR